MSIKAALRTPTLILLAGAAVLIAAPEVVPADTPRVSVSDARLVRPADGSAEMEFVVTRSGDKSFPITAGYRTQDGTAKAGVDYGKSHGVLTIPAGAVSAAIRVPVLAGDGSEGRAFEVELMGASGPLEAGADLVAKAGFDVGGNFGDEVAADFNGDGRLDIAGLVLNQLPSPAINLYEAQVFLLVSTTAKGGHPIFAPRIVLPAEDYRDLRAADFNLDEKTDLVIATNTNRDTGVALVLLNNTPEGSFMPQFATPVEVRPGTNSSCLLVADLDGDGKPDIATSNRGEPTIVAVLLNTTLPGAATVSFASRKEFANPGCITGAADINGDQRTDLVAIASERFGSGAFLVLNTAEGEGGAPSFVSEAAAYIGAITAGPVVAADLNGDGRPELQVNQQIFVNTTPAGSLLPIFTDPIPVESERRVVAV